MRICWDNLEGVYLTRNGFLRKKNTTYIERPACKKCGQPYLTTRTRGSNYCGISCLKSDIVVSDETKKKISISVSGEKHPWYGRKHSEESKRKMSISSTGKKHTTDTRNRMSELRKGKKNSFYGKHHTDETKQIISVKNTGICIGENNPSYKGGIGNLDVVLFDDTGDKLSWCHDVRPLIEEHGLKVLQVRCFYSGCNKWFTPTRNSVYNRIQTINDNYGGNNNFYCSEECKNSCIIYGASVDRIISLNSNRKTIIDELFYTEPELKVWRAEVLKTTNHICEYCGKKANTAHHMRPKKTNQFFALDPYYGVACCQKCHNKIAHNDRECTYGYLAAAIRC